MNRRSRNAEHGLEQRSFPRRFHTAKHGFQKRGKPIVLPIIALLIALGGQFADRQGYKSVEGELTAPVVSAISGIDNGTAVTCFTHPDVTLCYRLTQERR